MSHARLAALALASISLLAAGCGKSSKSSSNASSAASATPTTASTTTTTTDASRGTATVKAASGRPLTRAQLIARADAICARTDTKLATILVLTTKEFARVLPQIAAYASSEARELSRLVPPANMAHSWSQLLGDFHLYGEYTNTIDGYARANNLHAASPLIDKADALRQETKLLAGREGFKRCSRSR